MKTIDVEVETTKKRYHSELTENDSKRIDKVKIETNVYKMAIHIENIVAVQEIEQRQSRLWLKSSKDPICINEPYASLMKRIREICNEAKTGC